MNSYAGNGMLSSFDDVLDAKYGKEGTPEREEFHRQARAYYMGEVLQEGTAFDADTTRRESK